MEARIFRTALVAVLLVVSMGARHQSVNFIVDTADARMAAQIAQAAEKYRNDLAIEWLGKPLPKWSQPCMMTVQVGPNLGAGGATTFVFDNGQVFGWRMTIQGSAERLIDSVLPHEITHMIFASHFRRPLPRWADEGGATNVECASEQQKHRRMLDQFLRTNRGIPMDRLFTMTDYPRDVMTLYAQGHSVAEYLILQGGRRKFVEFLSEAMRTNQWQPALKRHYGIENLATLQNTWVNWVAQGRPALPRQGGEQLAAVAPPVTAAPTATATRRPRPEPNLIYHIQGNTAASPAVAAPAATATPAAPARVPPVPTPIRPGGALVPQRISDSSDQMASIQTATMRELPADAWLPAGRTVPVESASVTSSTPDQGQFSGPTQEQVSRQPQMVPSRQVILEWSQP